MYDLKYGLFYILFFGREVFGRQKFFFYFFKLLLLLLFDLKTDSTYKREKNNKRKKRKRQWIWCMWVDVVNPSPSFRNEPEATWVESKLGSKRGSIQVSRHLVGPSWGTLSQPLTQTTLFHEHEAPDQSGRWILGTRQSHLTLTKKTNFKIKIKNQF